MLTIAAIPAMSESLPPEIVATEPSLVLSLGALFVMTAIPVVLFALFCDSVENDARQIREAGERLDRAGELARIRGINLVIILFQFMVFFMTTPVRREHPLVAYPLFATAMFPHLWTQNSLERKIREQPPGGFVAQAARGFFWSLAAGAVYLTVLTAVVGLAGIGAELMHASAATSAAVIGAGVIVGVLAGLLVSFSMSAFFVQRIFKSQPVSEGALFERVRAEFERAHLTMPKFYLLSIEQFQLGSAMIAGFRKGRGLFSPGLFISEAAIKALNEDELRAVLLHEVAHIRLNHTQKRMTYAAGMVICASLLTGLAVALTASFTADHETQNLAGCLTIATSFMVAFKLLGDHSRYQEIAADIEAIEKLGSSVELLGAALRKLDRVNDERPYRKEPGALMMSMGHPLTEKRIRILEIYFENKRWEREQKAAEAAEPAADTADVGPDQAA